ncbi:MAG: tRNA 2-thiocytidine(32) synthetase TtcA [Gammaproteobacteria bacterium]|nr:tRNA 2-thiocytidine(32) synthetase TtcA [Gammaproteobacteria bacterium]
MASVNSKKLQKRIRRLTATAIEQYQMIEDGDKIMVCLSGGKDSYVMLDMLIRLQKIAPISFKLLAVNLDQKQPGFDDTILPNYLDNVGVDYKIITEDTYSVVTDKIEAGKTMCSLCSRLRRGILYSFAEEHGCTKIALGHHKDDILETFFLNIFFGGTLKTMPPKLKSDNGKHIVIRPLSLVDESDLQKYSDLMEFPIIPCNLCGSQENLQRKMIKNMLTEWEQNYPNRKSTIFKALSNASPSHLLDKNWFDFMGLSVGQTPEAGNAWLMPSKPSLGDESSEINVGVDEEREKPIVFKPREHSKI